jgi:uncharacterized membrane protein YqjE
MAASPRPAEGEPGLRGSLRGLGHSALSLLRVRAELFGIELAEAQERLRTTTILSIIAAVFLGLGIQVLSILVIVVFWDSYRLHAIVGVGGLYLLIAAGAGLWILRLWRSGSPPFAATLQEFRNDVEALQGRHEP